MSEASKEKNRKAAKSSPVGKRGRTPAADAPTGKLTGKTSSQGARSDKPTSKRDQLAALLVRDEGATLAQMQEATGWLPHTVRAALTGLKKLGYGIDSDKAEGLRTYRAVAPK